ncbi:MAG: hypothetical protein ACE368_20685 [Paracoccaceae bacterium]
MIRENRPYDEIELGERASLTRVCTARDMYIFAHASGNLNPLHLPNDTHDDLEAVAPSMWVGGLISAVIGNVLPGRERSTCRRRCGSGNGCMWATRWPSRCG